MVIFDFDMTLVDSSRLEHLRKQRKWNEVMRRLDEMPVYDGIHDLIADLHAAAVPMAIVTKSPDMVPKAVIEKFAWPIKIVVGYHDVIGRAKPHPDGLLLALERAGVRPKDALHVGDKPEDTEASDAAGTLSIGAAWGLENSEDLKASKPAQLFETVAELRSFLLP